MSRWATVSVDSRSRSARVDLPWSMCAMMLKLRILVASYGTASGAGFFRAAFLPAGAADEKSWDVLVMVVPPAKGRARWASEVGEKAQTPLNIMCETHINNEAAAVQLVHLLAYRPSLVAFVMVGRRK